MLTKFKDTIHIKMDKEEIKEIKKKYADLQNSNHDNPSMFEVFLEFVYNDIDYDIMPMGDCLNDYCMAYDCLVNGGEYAININSYEVNKLLLGKTVIFKKFDYKYIENEDYKIELI